MKTQALLLAAGESRRFSGIKQLAPVFGQSMINYSLSHFITDEKLLTGLDGLTVVLGANANLIQKQLNKPLAININSLEVPEWKQGMGRSISAAIAQLDSDVSHVLIALADQIAITTENYRLLLKSSADHPNKIIAAYYANKLAVPAIFPRYYFTQLMVLTEDFGARKLLQAHQEQTVQLALPKAAVDIDTEVDLKKWLEETQ